MKKITPLNIMEIGRMDVIANYPLEGESKDEFSDKDNIQVFHWTVTEIKGSVFILETSLVGTTRRTIKKNVENLLDGYWWKH